MFKRNNNKEIDTDGLNEIIFLSKKMLRVFYVCLIVAVVLGVLIAIKELKLFNLISGVVKVISPLFIGFILTWLFYPLQKKLVDKGMNKALSAILIFILVAGFIILFVYIFIPVLYKQINDLINMLPSVFSNFTNLISKSLDKVDISGLDVGTLKKSIIESGQNMIVSITTKLPNSLISVVKSLISAVGIIALSLVIMIYMLMDFYNITFSFEKFLKKKGADDYVKLLNNIGYNARNDDWQCIPNCYTGHEPSAPSCDISPRRDSCDPVDGTQKASGAHGLSECGCG